MDRCVLQGIEADRTFSITGVDKHEVVSPMGRDEGEGWSGKSA
jgi:hypothetical protein